MSDLDLKNLTEATLDFKEDNLLSFVTLTNDGKYIACGGFDKQLTLIETLNPTKRQTFLLKYYAYCCLKFFDKLYIGGMNFIQVFDFKRMELIQTI